LSKNELEELEASLENSQKEDSVISHKEPLRTARFLNIGKKGLKISREHIHSPLKVSLIICRECGQVLNGGEKQK
jgi:hypothetical protein